MPRWISSLRLTLSDLEAPAAKVIYLEAQPSTGLGPEDPVNHVSNFNAYRSRRGPMVPPQSFIPQHLPEISATAEFSETPCGGRPVPRKTGGSLQNRLVVNLEFFRVHFWALWCLRSTAFSPGSLLGDLPCQNLP